MSAETLQQFLNSHQGCPFGDDYHLIYENIICSAYTIDKTDTIELTIKPLYSNQDIGNGAGNSVMKTFPKPLIYNKYEIEKERYEG